MEEFIGTVKAFAFGFTPRGWAPCEGQLMSIAQNQALFSLLGTTYGGDGRTTFGLPDLRGRSPMSQGNGPGLSDKKLGQKGGTETNFIQVSQLPPHSHVTDFNGQNVVAGVGVPAVNDDGTLEETEGNILANSANSYAAASAADTTLSPFNATVSGSAQSQITGGGQAVNNMQPFLALNYCICLQGVYPSRS
ncbi:MAG: tail fiber protein [Bacteroidota bacterium]